jgi:hypothetical protein
MIVWVTEKAKSHAACDRGVALFERKNGPIL